MSPSGRPDAAQQEAARRLEIEKRVRQVEAEILARAPETHVDPSLDEIRAVMELLGDPQHTFPVIHLTGTNGKTTTARMVEALLREAGLHDGAVHVAAPALVPRADLARTASRSRAERLVETYDEVLPMVQLADAARSSAAAAG